MSKEVKIKEPIRIRTKKLNNGNESIYLDIYVDGKRNYEFLKLYLVPEKDRATKNRNAETMKLANAWLMQRSNNLCILSNLALNSVSIIIFSVFINVSKDNDSA